MAVRVQLPLGWNIYLLLGGGTESLVSIFVPGVIQENEDAWLVQPLPYFVFNPSETFNPRKTRH